MQAGSPEVAASCLPAVIALAAANGGAAVLEGEDEHQLDAQALPTAAHFEAVAADLATAQSAVLPEVLLVLLASASAATLDKVRHTFARSLSSHIQKKLSALFGDAKVVQLAS